MYEREPLGRWVDVKSFRKGHGGKGKERSGKTGKRGYLYSTNADGTEKLECDTGKCATFDEVQGKLRSTNLLPTDVALKHPGETSF